MTIKERIGTRIKTARKDAGLTIREVSEKAGNIKPARLSNWEQGLRTPGPAEVNLLSELLGVSAAYLMCLTDKKDATKQDDQFITMLPLLDEDTIKKGENQNPEALIHAPRLPIDNEISKAMSEHAFAFKISDPSMAPEFALGDLIAVDPDRAPKPGQFAMVLLNGALLIRKIRDKGSDGIDLVPTNHDWPTHSIPSLKQLALVATVIEHRRHFL